MPKGYKIDTSNYIFKAIQEVIKDNQIVIDEKTGEPKTETKELDVYTRELLPILLCNPQLGGSAGQPDPEFDLYEMGVIAKLIERGTNSVVLDSNQYDKLKKRAGKMSKMLGYRYFEMIRRIQEAEEVELGEKKALKE